MLQCNIPSADDISEHGLFSAVDLVLSSALIEEFADVVLGRKFAAILARPSCTPARILEEIRRRLEGF
jgi:hypothetical protein